MAEGIDDCVRADIPNWYGHRPARKAVDQREKVVVTIGEGHRNQIHVEVGEALVRYFEIPDRRDRVPGYFGTLAIETVPGPS